MELTPPSLERAHVGTSGFAYPTWRPDFYPAGSRPQDFLRLYAERLPSVELHATFYRLPTERQLQAWADETPPGFVFAVRLHRAITHGGRVDLAATFCERVRVLGPRLGPVLLRVPDERPRDDGPLRLLLESLDPELRVAVEAHHPSWNGVEPLLDELGAVRVGSLEAAAPFRYLRLRDDAYDEASLAACASRLRPLLAGGVELHAYFRHEDEPHAPRRAQRLLALLAEA